jgi:hypothetical protein
MVAVSLGEDAGAVREWAEELEVTFPVWIDPGGRSLAAFAMNGHPSTVLIDRAGRIVGRIPGERDWRSPEARRLIEWLLAGPGAAR